MGVLAFPGLLGLGINLAWRGGFCCVPAFHPSRQQLASMYTHLRTHTTLSSRVLFCLANAVQIEGAIHLRTVPKSKGEKHAGQTNSLLRAIGREGFLTLVFVTVASIWALRPLATFLSVCLSTLKTGRDAAGVNGFQRADHRLLLSSVIFYYLIKKQEIRFPLSEKELILLSQSDLSWERWREWGRRVIRGGVGD